MATTDYTLTDADVGRLLTPPDGFGVSIGLGGAGVGYQTPNAEAKGEASLRWQRVGASGGRRR